MKTHDSLRNIHVSGSEKRKEKRKACMRQNKDKRRLLYLMERKAPAFCN